jgi:hypothetical protein
MWKHPFVCFRRYSVDGCCESDFCSRMASYLLKKDEVNAFLEPSAKILSSLNADQRRAMAERLRCVIEEFTKDKTTAAFKATSPVEETSTNIELAPPSSSSSSQSPMVVDLGQGVYACCYMVQTPITSAMMTEAQLNGYQLGVVIMSLYRVEFGGGINPKTGPESWARKSMMMDFNCLFETGGVIQKSSTPLFWINLLENRTFQDPWTWMPFLNAVVFDEAESVFQLGEDAAQLSAALASLTKTWIQAVRAAHGLPAVEVAPGSSLSLAGWLLAVGVEPLGLRVALRHRCVACCG